MMIGAGMKPAPTKAVGGAQPRPQLLFSELTNCSGN
jgi:hypothetical protein